MLGGAIDCDAWGRYDIAINCDAWGRYDSPSVKRFSESLSEF